MFILCIITAVTYEKKRKMAGPVKCKQSGIYARTYNFSNRGLSIMCLTHTYISYMYLVFIAKI